MQCFFATIGQCRMSDDRGQPDDADIILFARTTYSHTFSTPANCVPTNTVGRSVWISN